MPMVSKAKNRWMWANKPEMAKEWAAKTPSIKALPDRIRRAKIDTTKKSRRK